MSQDFGNTVMSEVEISIVEEFLTMLPETPFNHWGSNCEKLLLRLYRYFEEKGLGGINYFLSQDKTIIEVLKAIHETSRKKIKGSTLKQYLMRLILFLNYWSGFNKYTQEAEREPRILIWKNGKNFIGSLRAYADTVTIIKVDKEKKYSPERIDRLIKVIDNLSIPEVYKKLVYFSRFTLRRRSAICFCDIEHIDKEARSITFYEKGQKEHVFDEFTQKEWIKLQKWLFYRDKISRVNKIDIVDFNPMTGKEGHPLFWNKNYKRLKPESVSDYFYKLSKREICSECHNFLSEYELRHKYCEKCRDDLKETLQIDYNIHLSRGAGASDLLNEGISVDDVADFGGWDSVETVRNHYDASSKKKARIRVRKAKESISKCLKCLKRIPTDASFCAHCGSKINNP